MKDNVCRSHITRILFLSLLVIAIMGLLSASAAEPAYNSTEWAVLRYTNKHRMAHGLKPLSMIPRLQTAAKIRARELIQLYDHTRPDGSDCFTVLGEVGLDFHYAAENIASGQSSAYQAFEAWRNSTKGHNENMLSSRLYHVGCGYTKGDDYGTRHVQMFINTSCSTQGIRLVLPEKPLTAHAKTTIESLGIKVVGACSVHGDSYMPLIREMCSDFDFSKPGPHKITVSLDAFTADFTVNPGIAATGITLEPAELILHKGVGSAQMKAVVLPESADNKDIVWSVEPAYVASIDEQGLVTAGEYEGSATITATTVDGSEVSATCSLRVITPHESISIGNGPFYLSAGGPAVSVRINREPQWPTITDLTWDSDNEQVATVGQDGMITPLKAGTTTITATTTDGSGKTANCEVIVKPPAQEVVLSHKALYLQTGGPGSSLTASVLPAEAHQHIEWAAYDDNIAVVDNVGFVTPRGEGSLTVYAGAADGSGASATCRVHVAPLSQGLNLDQSALSLAVGGYGQQLTASIQPLSQVPRKLVWSSSNEQVATVDDDGFVKPLADGKTVITAEVKDGSGITASCEVTVRPPVAEITLDQQFLYMKTGEASKLTAKVLPSNAEQRLTWSSHNHSVATVDDNGVVTAVAPGDAFIDVASVENSFVWASCLVIVRDSMMLPGDADNDGDITTGDLMAIVDFLVSSIPPAAPENADVDGMNGIGIDDLVWIIRYIIK